MAFSVGPLYEGYEEVYMLNFDRAHRNIMTFMERSPCKIWINFVRHDIK